MFERYTEDARRALFYARYEASALGGAAIDSAHLLLAVVRVAQGPAREAFALAGISRGALRREVRRRAPGGEKLPTSVEMPFSDAFRRILQATTVEADRLGHAEIGAEHLLLGILSESDTLACQVLAENGMVLDAARQAIAPGG